jgi:hypothetical protein
MINVIDATDRLLRSYPHLEQIRLAVALKWQPEEPPATVLYSAFGQSISETVGHLSNDEKTYIFDTIEQLLLQGDDIVRAAVATGLLEALLSQSSSNRFDFRAISNHLRPNTRHYCQEWDRFTGCSTPGLE